MFIVDISKYKRSNVHAKEEYVVVHVGVKAIWKKKMLKTVLQSRKRFRYIFQQRRHTKLVEDTYITCMDFTLYFASMYVSKPLLILRVYYINTLRHCYVCFECSYSVQQGNKTFVNRQMLRYVRVCVCTNSCHMKRCY